MNIDIEVTLKVKASDDTSQVKQRRSALVCLLDRLASHPCIVMILREIMRNS